jgi:hypothetical protein
MDKSRGGPHAWKIVIMIHCSVNCGRALTVHCSVNCGGVFNSLLSELSIHCSVNCDLFQEKGVLYDRRGFKKGTMKKTEALDRGPGNALTAYQQKRGRSMGDVSGSLSPALFFGG